MSLRVVTLNVWALMPPIGSDVLPRMRAIGEALPALASDLAVFQEVWHAPARDVLVTAGREAGLVHAWHPPRPIRSGGLLVLSRQPIRGPRFEAYELAGLPEAIAHADYWGGKGFVEFAIDTPGGELRVLVTHLHASYAPRERDGYVGHRVGQLLQLVERIAAIRDPVLLAGDLNFAERHEEHAILTGLTGLSDVARALDARQPTVLRDNPYRNEPETRIDYHFVRDGARAAIAPRDVHTVFTELLVLDGRPAAYSDHAGLLAELEVHPTVGDARSPEASHLATARSLLASGRVDAVRRRDRQRATAAAGLAIAPLAWLARRREALTRRALLRRGAAGLALLAGGVGAGSLARSELLRPAELEAFDAGLARVARLARDLAPGAAGSGAAPHDIC